jgi:hypothetical protein
LHISLRLLRVSLVALLLLGIALFATGYTDTDWMHVCDHFQFGQGGKELWEFCPFWKVNWWIAYQISVIRICAGCFLIGFVSAFLLFYKFSEDE